MAAALPPPPPLLFSLPSSPLPFLWVGGPPFLSPLVGAASCRVALVVDPAGGGPAGWGGLWEVRAARSLFLGTPAAGAGAVSSLSGRTGQAAVRLPRWRGRCERLLGAAQSVRQAVVLALFGWAPSGCPRRWLSALRLASS